MAKLTKKRYLSIVRKAIRKDIDTDSISNIISDENMRCSKKSVETETSKTEILRFSDIPPNGNIASIVLAMYAVNYIVISASGQIIGEGRSIKSTYVIMFELEDGRLAVAHHDGNYAMTRDDVPPMMMEIFP
jgi:hypothetical protein